MSRLARWVLYPILLPAIIVLQHAISAGVAPLGFSRALMIAVVAGTALLGLWQVVLRNSAAAGLMALGTMLLIFSRDPILGLLTTLRDWLGVGGATLALGALTFLALAAIATVLVLLRRGQVPTPRGGAVTRALNVFSLLLLAIVIVPALPRVPGWLVDAGPANRVLADDPSGPDRDVYVFILDGYARSDELVDRFGIDNAPFLTSLRGLGFDVAVNSRSNYTYSALTFTSMFEQQHLLESTQGSVQNSDLQNRLARAIRDGPTVSQIRTAGFEVVGTAAGWEHVSFRGGLDRFVERPELTDVERQLLQRTWLLDLPPMPENLFFAELHKRTVGILDDAVALASEDGRHPVFAFVHVPAPHLPPAFGSDGGPPAFPSRMYGAGRASEFNMTDAEFATTYAHNLEELNARVLTAVTSIRAASAERGAAEPAIVIMSDHGYIGDEPVHGPAKLANLFAWSLPEAVRQTSEFPTPVNLVPALLSAYLEDPGVEPVPDRFFTTVIRGQTLDLTEIPRPERDAE